ncbi:MAG: hypothetical protein NTY10_07015 [Candidatus Omnitrophica bacterium]|nr:hypothetical protein [Candidatus Omnitrophota bacterium]
MEPPEKDGAKQAAEKVASFLNTRITKTGITYRVLSFNPRHLFFDNAGHTYTAHFNQRTKGYLVLVESAPETKKNELAFPVQKFLVRRKSIFIYTNFTLIAEYLSRFLKKRGYPVGKTDWSETTSVFQFKIVRGAITAGPFSALVQANFIRNRFSARMKDKDEKTPYFCSLHNQYVFTFRHRLLIKNGAVNLDNLLLSYAENEIKSAGINRSPGDAKSYLNILPGVNPVALFKKTIYGLRSPNLRAFYSDEGLMPEARRVMNLVILLNLASSIISASVFVRVAERLKGNTWYTLAAGALLFLRVPAEIFNMRRSLKITRNLPGSRIQKIEDSEEFRAVYEAKPFRSWRNFERGYTELFRGTEYLPEKIEKYRLVKPTLYKLIAEGKKEEVALFLRNELGLNEEATASLLPLAQQLQPLDREEVKAVFSNRIERLKKEGLTLESEWPNLLEFVNRTLPNLLERDTVSGAYKSLKNALKRAERPPERAELFTLVDTCYRTLIPFRRADFLFVISLLIVGYSATYSPDMPIIAFAIYYLFNGVMIQLLLSGYERISMPVWMQYIFREMENDPAIVSASDTWNEFNSQQTRLLTIFSSLGLILGVSGRLLAKTTHNISWFGVDALAVLLLLLGLREWFKFYQGLRRRCRLEE